MEEEAIRELGGVLPLPTYEGREYTAEDVESLRGDYRERHASAAAEFRQLEQRYADVSGRMRGELGRERMWEEELRELAEGPGRWQRVRDFFARIGVTQKRRPVSELLEEQLESVQQRIHAVAKLRESLDGQSTALEADIRRLNAEITAAARNEERAAAHVLALSETLEAQNDRLLYWDAEDQGSAAFREASARADELRAEIRMHGAKARGFGHAETRLSTVVRMNRSLLEILKHTAENMEQLTEAAHQVTSELSGNVAALVTLSLAGEMAVDLMTATRHLKEGINRVAAAASTTSLELTRDLDTFVADMSVYDEDTLALVERNLSDERRLRQQQVDDALATARVSAGE